MKKSTNQNKLGMIDWMLSIDFDPVEISRVRRDSTTIYVSLLDEKALSPKRGD
jgi:hypothetical protein